VPVRIRPAIASPRSVSAVNTEPARPVAQDEVETQRGSVSLVVGNDSYSAFGVILCFDVVEPKTCDLASPKPESSQQQQDRIVAAVG
jgi:hypothetical protein